MRNEHGLERLSAYVDGELTAQEAAAVEAHVRHCHDCATVLDGLREVVTLAGDLEPRTPGSDLWPGVEGRLVPRPARSEGTTGPIPLGEHRARKRAGWPGWGLRQVALTVPQLVAAGLALVLFSAGAMWLVMGSAAGTPGAGAVTGEPGLTGSPPGLAQAGAPATFAATYEAAVQDLEGELQRRRDALDPATIAVVERNLAIIDEAIAEARSALEADPSNAFLNGYLADTMLRKVDLLRQATRIQRTEI